MIENICGFAGTIWNPAASYGVKDIVSRWAVFARVYREDADDVVLWPKHGLPIQTGPEEEAVALRQVVMVALARAQVLDRTMAELRRERQARVAEEGQASRHAGTPATKPCRRLQSQDRVAEEGACTPRPGELGSFGVEGKRTPYGGTTNPATGGNHGRDARATKDHGQDARATKEPGELGSFGVETERTPYGVATNGSDGAGCPALRDRGAGAPGPWAGGSRGRRGRSSCVKRSQFPVTWGSGDGILGWSRNGTCFCEGQIGFVCSFH